MGQIKNLYKKVHGSFNNPEHKRHWQGGVGIFVMALFVLSSVLFSKTVQAVIQAAGNYGYYSGSYGYQGSVTTADAIPADPTAISCSGTTGGTTATCTVTHSGLTTTSTSTGTLTATVEIYEGAISGSSCAGTTLIASNATGTGTTSIESGTLSLTAGTSYCAVSHVTDAASNNSSGTVSVAGTFIAVASSSSGGGQAAGSLSSKTVTPADVVAAVPGGDIVPPASVAVVTSVQGHLGGTVDQALTAVQGSGANLAHSTAVSKQTAAAARQELFGTNNAVVAELLVATGLAKDTTAALKKVDAKAIQTLENALAVAVAVRSELGDVVDKNGKVVETAAVRTARFLNTVLPPAVLALAVSDANIAGPLAESLIVAAAVGNIDDDLRRELLAKWTALGVKKEDRDFANGELELREKQIAGLYLVFYGSGPQTSAQWSLYLAIAYGARHPESADQGDKEKVAMTLYHSKKALVTWPFGPLTLTKSLSKMHEVGGVPENIQKQMKAELNLGLLTAIEDSREGKALSKGKKVILAKDKKGETVRARAERYYGLGFSLIQSAARADLTGVRALPALPKA